MNCCRCENHAVWRVWVIVMDADTNVGAYCEGCLDREVEYAYTPWYATPILPGEGPFVGGWDIDDTEEGS